ncbi:hypothetical protein HII31_06352 [Pseudocercospora fuligena]|uniref:CENP-V/GFA domain-containing protein n=1 Tax=Pseudocercospora fuligena TaxID=685502 RepID=A0A8H6VMN2_9PEZI|nr:hypothetical protein HII31_06352 [Pseudocercospora fuligena]
MEDDTRTIKASCLCGSSAHTITLPKSAFPLKGYMCHCSSCRHMTGSLCHMVAFLPASYQPEQSLVDRLTGYVLSKRVTQYFCPTCGCQMMTRCLADGNDPDSQVQWDVATGTLEQLDDTLEWQGHYYLQDTLDGGFSDMLMEVDGKVLSRWPADFGKGGELPLHWQSPSRPKLQTSSNDKLRAHCKCGGVELYISRPSARSAVAKKAWPELPRSEDVKEEDVPAESDTHWLRDKQTKFLGGLCACNSCRLVTGMEFIPWAFIPLVDLSLDAEGEVPFPNDCQFGTIKYYNSSKGCHRFFCKVCGATCFWDGDDRKYIKDIAFGLLDAPEGTRAESWFGWRTNNYGYREDTIGRADEFTLACERGLEAWEASREGPDLSGPPHTPGAY